MAHLLIRRILAQSHCRTSRASRRAARKGASAVEFALVAPLLFLGIALPMIEFGRALMVSSLLTNVARTGCRAAVLPSTDSATVTTIVNSTLSSEGISGATATITVNGGGGDVRSAMQGDIISVTVSVPYSSISWLPLNSSFYLRNKTLTSTQVMRRE